MPLPETILPELRGHLELLKDLQRRDLDRGYAGVFLVNALERKFKKAAREFIRQWFFAAKQLTYEPKAGEIFSTLTAQALYSAVREIGSYTGLVSQLALVSRKRLQSNPHSWYLYMSKKF